MARGTVGVILALTLAVALLLPPHHSLAPPGMISGARAATLRLPHRWLSAPENLLTNGDFSAGTSGWSALSGTLAAVNGGLRLTTTAGFGLACQAVAVVPGASYRATALAYRVSGGTGARIQIKTNECDGSILVSAFTNSFTPVTLDTGVFVAPQATLYFTLVGGSGVGAVSHYDDAWLVRQ